MGRAGSRIPFTAPAALKLVSISAGLQLLNYLRIYDLLLWSLRVVSCTSLCPRACSCASPGLPLARPTLTGVLVVLASSFPSINPTQRWHLTPRPDHSASSQYGCDSVQLRSVLQLKLIGHHVIVWRCSCTFILLFGGAGWELVSVSAASCLLLNLLSIQALSLYRILDANL